MGYPKANKRISSKYRINMPVRVSKVQQKASTLSLSISGSSLLSAVSVTLNQP